MHGHDPYDIPILRATFVSCGSHRDSFIVPRSLSTTWSTKTVLSTDSQVVVPLVRGFNLPSNLIHEYPSITLASVNASCSSLYGALPYLLCLLRWGHSHGSRATNSSNAVVWLAIPCPIMLSFPAQHACMILVTSLLISLFNNMLFFHSRTQSSSSSQSFKFPRRMVSCNYIILLPGSSCTIPTMGAVVWGFFSALMVSSLLFSVGFISTLRAFLMAL